jgi:hypothetical protein
LTIECSHQGINGGGDIMIRFCEILHECDLLASEFKSAKIPTAVRIYRLGPEDDIVRGVAGLFQVRVQARRLFSPTLFDAGCNGHFPHRIQWLFLLYNFALSWWPAVRVDQWARVKCLDTNVFMFRVSLIERLSFVRKLKSGSMESFCVWIHGIYIVLDCLSKIR